MRRNALLGPLLGIVLTLPGCVGMDDFIADTHGIGPNPNMPMGDGLNIRRVQGMSTEIVPIAPEPGNVWPRSVEPLPTLFNVEQEMGITPGRPPRGPTSQRPTQTGALPAELSPADLAWPVPSSRLPPVAAPSQANSAPSTAPAPLPPAPALPQTVIPTATGPATITTGTERYQTVNTPTGTAVVVPNGNGTATLMRSDGTMETVTLPR